MLLSWECFAQLRLTVLSMPIALGWEMGVRRVSSLLCWACV